MHKNSWVMDTFSLCKGCLGGAGGPGGLAQAGPAWEEGRGAQEELGAFPLPHA